MEVLSLFSISDFLAFLFPGTLSLSGIYVILLLTPLQYFIQPPKDIGGWFAFFVVSYVTGILLSALTSAFLRGKASPMSRRQIKQNIQIHDENMKIAVITAFNELILKPKGKISKRVKQPVEIEDWNASCYFICRSLVMEMMPRVGANAIREAAYRQLRMNLIGSLVIWSIAGVLWGIVLISQPSIIYEVSGNSIFIDKLWAIALTISSIIIPSYVISKVRQSMDRNEQREVREILTAFLAGYKAGVFDKRVA